MKKKSLKTRKLTFEKFEISRLNLSNVVGGHGSHDAGADSGVNVGCGSNVCITSIITRRHDQIFTVDH